MNDISKPGRNGGPNRSTRRRSSTAEVAILEDALSMPLTDWPEEAPTEPKTAGDRARLELIHQPGVVRLTDWSSTDRARANRRARSYRTADPTKLDPTAGGTFQARVYHDSGSNKYRVAVRYMLNEER